MKSQDTRLTRCRQISFFPCVALCLSVLTVVSTGPVVCATEFRGGAAVHINDEDILDDLFIAGNEVSVNAHVIGDLFAAGVTISLGDSAIIENSFMAAGRRVDISGTVVNSARAFAQDINIRGHVEGNVMGFAGSLILDNSGWIEKDLSLFCGDGILRGRIGGKVKGKLETAVISGKIDGDVDIEAKEITILPSAIIGGKFRYKSTQEAKVEEGAQIFGGTERVAPEEPKGGGYGIVSFLWDTWWFLAKTVVGFVLLLLFQPFVAEVKDTLLQSSLRSLSLGFLFLVCLPVAAVVLAITLLGAPLAFLTLLGWFVLLYISKIFVALAVGEWLLARLRGGKVSAPLLSLLAGLLLVTIVTMIPYAGMLIQIMVVSLGFGAFFITAYQYRTRGRPAAQ